MKRFINWMFGKKELTVEIHLEDTFTPEKVEGLVKFADKMRKEHSCNCTLVLKHY